MKNPQEIRKPAAGQQTGKKQNQTYVRKYIQVQAPGKPRLSFEAALAFVSQGPPCSASTAPLWPPVSAICWQLPKRRGYRAS